MGNTPGSVTVTLLLSVATCRQATRVDPMPASHHYGSVGSATNPTRHP